MSELNITCANKGAVVFFSAPACVQQFGMRMSVFIARAQRLWMRERVYSHEGVHAHP